MNSAVADVKIDIRGRFPAGGAAVSSCSWKPLDLAAHDALRLTRSKTGSSTNFRGGGYPQGRRYREESLPVSPVRGAGRRKSA